MHWKLIGITTGLLWACASGPSVRPQQTQTTGAVRAAEEVGAQELPQASLHLKLAHDNARRAEAAMEEGDEEVARRLFERAEVDAELAIQLVKEEQARREVHDVNEELAELQSRLDDSAESSGR